MIPRGVREKTLCCLPRCIALLAPERQSPLRLTVLDMGQGLGLVLETQSRTLVYDTGARYSTTFNGGSGIIVPDLRSRGIDHIDLLLIHRPDPLMDHIETGAALDEVVASGKVRAVGVSNFKPHDWDLLQSAMTQKLVTNQIEMSVVENSAFTNGDLAFLQEFGVPPMAWSLLAGRALFRCDNPKLLGLLQDIGAGDAAAAAVAWLLAHPARILPVFGTNNLTRIAKLDAACAITFDRELWFEVFEAANGQEVP